MIAIYKGDKDGYSLNLGATTIYMHKGHPYYLPPNYKNILKNNENYEIIDIEDRTVPNHIVEKQSKKFPKYLFYPPSMEVYKIYFLSILKYWCDCNFTAQIDICCPYEYRELFYGYNVNLKDVSELDDDYDRVFRYDKENYSEVLKKLIHPIQMMYTLLALDKVEMEELGYTVPYINCEKDNKQDKFTIGLSIHCDIPRYKWDQSQDHSKITQFIKDLKSEIGKNIQIYLFENHSYSKDYLKSQNIKCAATGVRLYQHIKEIAQCDLVVTLANSKLGYYAAAVGVPTIPMIGDLKPELTIGCFPSVEGYFDGEDFENIPIENIVKYVVSEAKRIKSKKGGGANVKLRKPSRKNKS